MNIIWPRLRQAELALFRAQGAPYMFISGETRILDTKRVYHCHGFAFAAGSGLYTCSSSQNAGLRTSPHVKTLMEILMDVLELYESTIGRPTTHNPGF
jgi:hypothetical protein